MAPFIEMGKAGRKDSLEGRNTDFGLDTFDLSYPLGIQSKMYACVCAYALV